MCVVGNESICTDVIQYLVSGGGGGVGRTRHPTLYTLQHTPTPTTLTSTPNTVHCIPYRPAASPYIHYYTSLPIRLHPLHELLHYNKALHPQVHPQCTLLCIPSAASFITPTVTPTIYTFTIQQPFYDDTNPFYLPLYPPPQHPYHIFFFFTFLHRYDTTTLHLATLTPYHDTFTPPPPPVP